MSGSLGSEIPAPRALVVMGVSGSGKTVIAALLAERLGWDMVEGDRMHPPQNVEKMRRGVPLDDADRWPWLDRIGERLRVEGDAGNPVILTCSALKRAYRERLLAARPDLVFVYLKGTEAQFGERIRTRQHEFMPASLLRSQFETLEEPGPDEPVVVVDASLPPVAEAEAALQALGLD